MAKAVGFGGIFLKAQDPKALSAWYATHLGIQTGEGGVTENLPGYGIWRATGLNCGSRSTKHKIQNFPGKERGF
jgi:hypothetical protein